jgi:hypothetical protein
MHRSRLAHTQTDLNCCTGGHTCALPSCRFRDPKVDSTYPRLRFSQLLEELSISAVGVRNKLRRLFTLGYLRTLFEALVPCVPNYCARKICKKPSTSVVGVNRKLRRLSSVGSTWNLQERPQVLCPNNQGTLKPQQELRCPFCF